MRMIASVAGECVAIATRAPQPARRPAEYGTDVNRTDALTILLAVSGAVCLGLTALVAGRKGARDRRERQGAERRRRYAATLVRGGPGHLQAIAHEAAAGGAAQVDLAIAASLVRDGLGPERRDAVARAAEAAGLVDALLRGLRSRRAVDRGRAALLITRPGLALAAAESVAPLVRDPDPDVRLTAIGGLAEIGTAGAAHALIGALAAGDTAPERIVERLGAPWAAGTVIAELARDGPGPVRRARAGRQVAVRASLAAALGLAGDPAAEPVLLGLLAAGGEEERVSAARALGTAGAAAAMPALIGALEDGEWPVRAQAAKSLGRLGAVGAVPALERCLADRAWWVRANAASALRALGAPGRAALTRALASPDPFARDRAREQLELDAVAQGATP